MLLEGVLTACKYMYVVFRMLFVVFTQFNLRVYVFGFFRSRRNAVRIPEASNGKGKA